MSQMNPEWTEGVMLNMILFIGLPILAAVSVLGAVGHYLWKYCTDKDAKKE